MRLSSGSISNSLRLDFSQSQFLSLEHKSPAHYLGHTHFLGYLASDTNAEHAAVPASNTLESLQSLHSALTALGLEVYNGQARAPIKGEKQMNPILKSLHGKTQALQ